MIQNVEISEFHKKYMTSNVSLRGDSNRSGELSAGKKAVILSSSIIGSAPVVAFWAKKAGFSLNPAKILKTPIMKTALFAFDKSKGNVINYKAPQILSIAGGSIAGGFVGGAIVDKENLKAKKREVLTQVLGNILTPVSCVWAGSELLSGQMPKLQKFMPQISGQSKLIKYLNSGLKNLPNTVATLFCLSIGIWAGNRVSNFINDKIYHKKVERNLKATDFAPHLDDLCMGVSMMNENSTFASVLGRFIPLALIVPGYQTGKAQGKD